MANQPIDVEVIDLESDDGHSDFSPSATTNGTTPTITPMAKEKMKNLWNRLNGVKSEAVENSGENSNSVEMENGHSPDTNGCFSDASLSPPQQPTSTTATPEPIGERNLFEVLQRTLSSISMSDLSMNGDSAPMTVSNGVTLEKPSRKRSRVPVNDNGEGEQACCSKQKKISNGEIEAEADRSTSPQVVSPIPEERSPSPEVASTDVALESTDIAVEKPPEKICDCVQVRRELSMQMNFWKSQSRKYEEKYGKLKDELEALKAKIDAAANVERRTVSVQVGTANERPAEDIRNDVAGSSATKSTPNPSPAKTAAPPPPPMPNLRRYPSQTFTGSPAVPTRPMAPISAVQAPMAPVRLPPPTPNNLPPKFPPPPSGSLPPRLPLASQKPMTPTVRPTNLPDHITVVSSTGTTKVMLASNANAHIPQEATTSSIRNAAYQPPSNQILTAMLASNTRQALPKAAADIPKPAVPQNPTPPRLVRAPLQMVAPQMSTPPSMMARATVTRPTLAPRSAPTTVRPNLTAGLQSAPPAPAPTYRTIRPDIPLRTKPDCQLIAAVKPQPTYPPLPVLRSYVSPSDLNAASAALRPLPPKPSLKVNRDDDARVTLRWDMPPMPHGEIREYRLYSFKEGGNEPWTIVGGIVPMELPMACTLSMCVRNNKYYFALTAEDTYGRFGPFSEICSVRV